MSANDASSQKLINDFFSWLDSNIENNTPLSSTIARTLLYWPTYIDLLNGIAETFTEPRRQILHSRIDEAISETLDTLTDPESGAYSVNWSAVLLIMLSAGCKHDDTTLRKKLNLLYEQLDEDKDGLRVYKKERKHFYYRFAAAFQDWIIYHRNEPWYAGKDTVCRARTDLAMCRDCKAHIAPPVVTLDVMYLYYKNVSETLNAFQAIFGFSANEIDLVADGNSSRWDADIDRLGPILASFSGDSISSRLWGENIWMMREIERLARVHSGVHQAQRIVERTLNSDTGADNSGFEKLFVETIYKTLKVRQVTMFLRELGSDNEDQHITFRSTEYVAKKLRVSIPVDAYMDKIRYRNFTEVIRYLFKNRLPTRFFNDIQDDEKSTTNKDRTFPFFVVPDGEVAIYYAAAIATKNHFELQIDHQALQGQQVNEDLYWSDANWWKQIGNAEPTGGIFPPAQEGGIHHRCSALVSASYMCSGANKNRFRFWDEHLAFIRREFCPKFSNEKDEDPSHDSILNPTVALQKLLSNLANRKWDLRTVFDNARVNFLPEIILRHGDSECHTLFFLPIGNYKPSVSTSSDFHDEHVPLAMIAGTLRGVEKRWLPFNSYRIVAHLYPMARMLQPLIDRMSRIVFEEGRTSEKERNTAEQRRKTEESRWEKLKGEFNSIQEAIKSLGSASFRIEQELLPSSGVLLGRNWVVSLSRYFAPDAKTLTLEVSNPEEFADLNDRPRVLGNSHRGLCLLAGGAIGFCPVHARTDLTDAVAGTYVDDLLRAITVEYRDTPNLNARLTQPLRDHLKEDPSVWSSIFELLKDVVLRTSQESNRALSPWMVLVPICLLAIELDEQNASFGVGLKLFRPQGSVDKFMIIERPDGKATIDISSLMKMPQIRAELSKEWGFSAVSRLVAAILTVLGSALKPGSQPATLGNARVYQVDIEIRESTWFDLVFTGAGGFVSEKVFRSSGDDAQNDQHNLRPPVNIIARAVGYDPTLLNLTDDLSDFHSSPIQPPFSVSQWKDRGMDAECRFKMRIRFGQK